MFLLIRPATPRLCVSKTAEWLQISGSPAVMSDTRPGFSPKQELRKREEKRRVNSSLHMQAAGDSRPRTDRSSGKRERQDMEGVILSIRMRAPHAVVHGGLGDAVSSRSDPAVSDRGSRS